MPIRIYGCRLEIYRRQYHRIQIYLRRKSHRKRKSNFDGGPAVDVPPVAFLSPRNGDLPLQRISLGWAKPPESSRSATSVFGRHLTWMTTSICWFRDAGRWRMIHSGV